VQNLLTGRGVDQVSYAAGEKHSARLRLAPAEITHEPRLFSLLSTQFPQPSAAIEGLQAFAYHTLRYSSAGLIHNSTRA
jgi:hypothetical protein